MESDINNDVSLSKIPEKEYKKNVSNIEKAELHFSIVNIRKSLGLGLNFS